MLNEVIGWLSIVSVGWFLAERGWVGTEGSEGKSVAGVRVMAISDQELQGFQESIDLIDLGWRRTL